MFVILGKNHSNFGSEFAYCSVVYNLEPFRVEGANVYPSPLDWSDTPTIIMKYHHDSLAKRNFERAQAFNLATLNS